MKDAQAENAFQTAHQPLNARLRRHLLAVVAGDFPEARACFQDWLQALRVHVELEETRLFPFIPDGARWATRVYTLEHARILALARDHLRLVEQVAGNPPRNESQIRNVSLDLLDAAHALRHVLEHHHQREEQALAEELPRTLQQSVFEQTQIPVMAPAHRRPPP